MRTFEVTFTECRRYFKEVKAKSAAAAEDLVNAEYIKDKPVFVESCQFDEAYLTDVRATI